VSSPSHFSQVFEGDMILTKSPAPDALYTGSLLNYNRHHNGAFVIASGAILGLGAAFLWITQGAIMLSYPLPHQKGRSKSDGEKR